MAECEKHPGTELVCLKCAAAKGGRNRSKGQTAAQRKRLARMAAKARWGKRK